MHRIQVQLTAAQERRLKELAKLRGSSVSALIRKGVDRLLAPGIQASDEKWDRAARAVGIFQDSATNVAKEHDRYLADAILAKRAKRTFTAACSSA